MNVLPSNKRKYPKWGKHYIKLYSNRTIEGMELFNFNLSQQQT